MNKHQLEANVNYSLHKLDRSISGENMKKEEKIDDVV